MFRAGDQIGNYVLKSRLGKGAFGVVWLAEEKTRLSTHAVALKLPNEEDVDLDAIRQEAEVWEAVKGHPNILPIIKADIADEQLYIASEYAPDGSLSDWLKKNGGVAPSAAVAVEMMCGILAGLAHLHSKRVIHRDLKPQNILLQGDTPRIADFGISRLIHGSHSSQIAGTPVYMSPECFSGRRSEQTDIWAAGVIFYQLLTGLLPYSQTDALSLMNAIVHGEPDIEIEFVPAPLRPILEKSLAKDARFRYQTAAEMRSDLRKIDAASLPEASAPTIRIERAADTGGKAAETATISQNAVELAETLPITAATNEAGQTTKPLSLAATIAPVRKNRSFAAAALVALLAFGAAAIYVGINYGKTPVAGVANANVEKSPAPSPSVIDNRALWAEWALMLDEEKFDKLIAETTAEIERNPNNAIAYRMRATAFYSNRQEERGRLDVRETLRLLTNPATAEEYEARCYGLKKLNKPDEAIENCSRAIELDKQMALAYNIRATVYHQKAMFKEAIADYDRAIELSPLNPVFISNRAISLEAVGKKDLAKKEENKAENIRKSKQPVPVNISAAPAASIAPLVNIAEPSRVPQPKSMPPRLPQTQVTADPKPSLIPQPTRIPQPKPTPTLQPSKQPKRQ